MSSLLLALHFAISLPWLAMEVRALSPEIRQFQSPMVLELTLERFLATPPEQRWTTYELRPFVCQEVSVDGLSLVMPRAGSNSAPIVNALIFLKNNAGKAKKATLTLELRQGDSLRSSTTLSQAIVAPGEPLQRAASIKFDVDRSSEAPVPALRITLTLVDYPG